jgi:hypothetical protein
MFRKITRILFKTIGILLLITIVLGVSLYFAIQSHTFQTWLGKKVGNYLGDELKTTVYINKISIDFFTKANLEGVYITDQRNDTLLTGDILVDIKSFNYEKQSLAFEKITLKNVVTKLIKYKSDSTLNYQFLYDYFASGKADTVSKKGWDVQLGKVFLHNLEFTYKNESEETKVNENINFNFLNLKNTYAQISNFKIDSGNIYVDISELRTEEQSGFKLNNLTTQAKISEKELLLNCLYLKTPRTLLKGEIAFKYHSWDDYSDFLNKIKINSELEYCYVGFKDIASFASELNGFNETVFLSGKIKGFVSDLNLSNFNLEYGKHTRFIGNLTITGLPDFSNSFLHFDAKTISTNYSDLIQIPNYPFSEGKRLEIPSQIRQFGTVTYKGKFDGFVTDFTTYGSFNSALGKLKTNLSIKLGKKTDDIKYEGKISTENFNLGILAGVSSLKSLSLNAKIKGQGLSLKALNASVEGNILSLTYNDYEYNDIKLNGTFDDKIFNGLLVSKDPNADFDFNGNINFENKIPQMDFISTVNNLNLKKLNFTKEETSISTQILINLKGDNINNISGTLNFDDTHYKNQQKEFKFSTIDLNLNQSTIDKKIVLNSNYANLAIEGRFSITNLAPAFNQFLNTYYPAFFQKNKGKTIYADALKFKLNIKKFNVFNELFVKSLMVSPNTLLNGDFDASKNLFNINLKSDSIKYGTIKFNNNVIESYSQNNKINLVFKGSGIQLTDSIKLDNYFMYLVSKDLDTKYNLEWNNKLIPNNSGKIAGKISFYNHQATLNLDKFFITAKDSTWNLTTTNPTVFDTSGNITINPMLFVNRLQSIGIAGTLSEKPNSNLVVNTNSVILEQFNPLLKPLNLSIYGILSGSVIINNSKTFATSSNLSFSNLKINNNSLGMLVLNSDYNSTEKNIFLDGYTSLGLPDMFGNQTKNISFKGNYFLDKREESIDIDFAASPANLKLLSPLLEGIITINNGLVTGQGKVHGSPDNIKVDGKLKLFSSEIKIDYTNVTYNITGEIEIMPDQIRFTDLLMKEKGIKAAPQGTINGNVFHNNFKKIQLDYDVTYRNMLVLNTTEKENKTFYGKIYGTGNVGIWGFLNNIYMSVDNTTNKNSKFYFPLDGPAEMEESDFIHFVKKDTIKTKKSESLTGFNLEMKIHATPDLVAQIILDKRTGDILNVQGLGDLNININTLCKFEMLGDYYITNGDYRFTLENVINKKFDIDAGSSISWSGDPMTAEINVVTSYKQRASVAPLLNDITGEYKGRFPVDSKLKITGKLFAPNISFAIDFPTIDATARARIANVLSDEAELNRQMFSFLLFRSFVTPQIYNSNSGGVTAGNAAASTGSEMLSNQVSSFLNSYVGNLTGLSDLQLGLNYRPGTQSNSDAIDLALSKQLFNNKVSIDGNFGVNGNNTNRNSSGIIDVNIEYKLTDDGRYRLKGFNRSNDNTQVATSGGPFTQGVGLFYREEFETFNQLFKRYLDKLKKKDTPKATN